jgi:hypothetical protein
LRDAGVVTIDRFVELALHFDCAIRPGETLLRNNLFEHRPQPTFVSPVQLKASAQAGLCQIKHIID